MKATEHPYGGLLRALDGPTLHALACLADDLRRPKILDPERAAEELAAMAPGTQLALGWWRRHLGVPSRTNTSTGYSSERTPVGRGTTSCGSAARRDTTGRA